MPRATASLELKPNSSLRKISAVLKYWNEREHLFLTGAGCIFAGLAVVAYWINGWSPGEIHYGFLGVYTDVDVVFYSLLVLTILSFGWALRPDARTQREWDAEEAERRKIERKKAPWHSPAAPLTRWWKRKYERKKRVA